MSVPGQNDVWLGSASTGGGESHFRLSEFEGAGGLCMVHRELLGALEALRFGLKVQVGREVAVIVTHAVRLPGWGGDPDAVEDSKHLPKYGGIAADVVAREVRSGAAVAQWLVGEVASRIFEFVKSDYADGHVHVDMRGFFRVLG